MADNLTKKQKMFCKEYLKDLNATQAAIRAGYSEKTAGEIASQNLKKLDIQEYLQKQMDKRAEKVDISAEYVLRGIKETTEECRDEQDRSGAFKGYELLGKHLKLFTDKIDHGGQSDNPLNIQVGFIDNANDTDTE